MPTLGLSMIVKDEAFEFNRCLESIQGELFDKIIIVRTHESKEIIDICEKFKIEHHFFKWIKDFSAARNFGFEKLKTDFCCFLDSDDIIKKESYNKLLELKPNLSKDIYLIDYIYSHTINDKPESILPRERIWKNLPELRFQSKIHETLPPIVNHSWEKLNNIYVDHYRMHSNDATRNLELLKISYDENPDDPRTQFYYGKDLYANGFLTLGVEILEKFVKSGLGAIDDRTSACIILARHYLESDVELSKLYCNSGLTINNRYAELYCVCGNIYKKKGMIDEAIAQFEKALECKVGTTLMTQERRYYDEVPHNELSILYFLKNRFQESLISNLKTYEISHNIGTLEDRKMLLEKVPIHVGWMTNMNLVNPIVRNQNIIHNEILKYNIKSEIISRVDDKFDCIVFTDFIQYEESKKYNGFKIFHLCEDISHKMLNEMNLIVCCSTRLQEKMKEKAFSNTVVIRDLYELSTCKTTYREIERPKLVFCGMGGNRFLVTDWLKETIEKAGYDLVTITEWDGSTYRWTLENWQKQMASCDVAICPQRQEIQDAKSNIKVTTAMSLGLPVVASNIKSYSEVIIHGINGYLCNTPDEFYTALVELRDVKKRETIGTNGLKSIESYSSRYIAHEWISEFIRIKTSKTKTTSSGNIKTQEPVDIIIVNYNNLEYLKQTISSVLLQTDFPYRLVISDAGSNKETWDYLNTLKGITVLGTQDKRINFSQACNNGILNSQTNFFVLLNSDVIVSWDCIKNMYNKMKTVPRLACCGVLSNCDIGFQHKAGEYEMNGLHPAMKIGEVDLNKLYGFMRTSNEKHIGGFKSKPWVAFYAVMLARSAVNEVGLLDHQFINGCEDLDYCTRLRKYGYEIGYAEDSFIFHYGGVTRYIYQQENKEKYSKEDKENNLKYNKKWLKKKVAIYCGPSWEKWNGKRVLDGFGGSESQAYYLMLELNKMGYETTIYCDLLSPEPGFKHYTELPKDLEYDVFDYFISSRSCEVLKNRLHVIKKFVWIHDIWISNDQNYDCQQWQVSKFICLSEWHKNFVHQHHKIPLEKIALVDNSVDIELYKEKLKKKNQIFYSSSADRGLFELLQMFPKIRESVPDLVLKICYGFNTWEEAVKTRGNPDEIKYIENIKSLMNQPGVEYLGRVSKQELAKVQLESKAWLYPTNFWETFCITSVEAGLANCAILSTKIAGLITTVGDSGILLTGHNASPEYQEEFIKESVRLLTDDTYRSEWAKKANDKMIKYTHENSAKQWKELFEPSDIKLNLGSGKKRYLDYLSCDCFPDKDIDKVFDLTDPPYESNSVSSIYSQHALEHVGWKKVDQALKNWYRILKPGGTLILRMPDLKLCCLNYVGFGTEFSKWTIYGVQESQDGEPDEAQYHRSGFSINEMAEKLKSIGYKVDKMHNYDGYGTPSFHIEAHK